MKIKTLTILTFFIFSIVNQNAKSDYSVAKSKIEAQRKAIKIIYLNASAQERKAILQSTKQVITKNLTASIIPFWYGTKWSFEGYTATPKEGKIACGYFVSTTLSHAGFKLNRYKLAQKEPKKEAELLQMSQDIEVLEKTPIELKKHFISTKKDGLYFVGLDFHVGYLLKENNELFFIHSSYVNLEGVKKETAITSKAFASKKYYIVPITENEKLVKKWILNETVLTN
ncbi:hypothetical protein [Flavobacterium sp.]|uniref:hypothetical protein n=1 Tax=Flavobacterium sp. TaxID=239 RepID=UPI002604E110|nr:hypothetical protein [Flavobacterium sp.]